MWEEGTYRGKMGRESPVRREMGRENPARTLGSVERLVASAGIQVPGSDYIDGTLRRTEYVPCVGWLGLLLPWSFTVGGGCEHGEAR